MGMSVFGRPGTSPFIWGQGNEDFIFAGKKEMGMSCDFLKSPGSASKEMLEEFVEQYMQGMMHDDFEALTPLQRLQIFSRIAGFVVPKIKSVELSAKKVEDSAQRSRLFRSLLGLEAEREIDI